MARWILGYMMFVLGIFWMGWDMVGPGPLLWGGSVTCLICSGAGGLLWWLDEHRWQAERCSSTSSEKDVDASSWPLVGSTQRV